MRNDGRTIWQRTIGFTRHLTWAAINLVICCCHHDGSPLTNQATPGLPLERYFPSTTEVLPVADSYARRYDTANGPQTDIWISGVELNPEQRRLFDSKSLSDAEVSDLRAPGILVRIKDDGSTNSNAFVICAARTAGEVNCTPSESGVVVISRYEPKRIRGAFFTDSKEHDQRYESAIDAPLTNASAEPWADADAWNDDSGRVGAVFSKLMDAAAQKDVEALRALSIPAREHDWDHFGIISSAQRTAREAPRVLAAYHKDSVAHLWVITTAHEGVRRLPFRVDFEHTRGDWRFAKLVF